MTFDHTLFLDPPTLVNEPDGELWVHSDLQLSNPRLAEQVLSHAVEDVLSLGLAVRAACCLGDAVAGKSRADLEQVARVTVEQMARLNVPICYLMGNHEHDLRRTGVMSWPLLDLAEKTAGWHTPGRRDGFFFVRRMFGALVVMAGDHAGADWWSSHGLVEGAPEHYPHHANDYQALRDAIGGWRGPVVFLSHYAFPGGQRPSALLAQMLPLPENIRLHCFGHAHIGDMVWNKQDPWTRRHLIAGHDIPQFNISALENVRSPGSHSAFIRFDAGEPVELRVRCHQEKKWVERFELTRRGH